MPIRKRTAGIFVASVLGLGVIASLALVSRQVQADTIVPGFATAHVHLNVTVCETPSLPAQVKFVPTTGKRYYFKDRTFDLAPGLNTIEWYVRKIPGGKYKVTLSPSQGVVTPDVQDVTLRSDEVSDSIDLSIYICEPTPVPAPIVAPTETIVSPSETSTAYVPYSSSATATAGTGTGGDIVPPPVPSLPSTTSI